MNLNDLRRQVLDRPISHSAWANLAEFLAGIDDQDGCELATAFANSLKFDKANDNPSRGATDTPALDSGIQPETTNNAYALQDMLESARSLLERGLPSECIGICKYLERKSDGDPCIKGWGKYLHGAASMDLNETDLAVSLLMESMQLHEISYAALILADFYAAEERFEIAFSYYTYAANWEPAIEGEARQQLEEKIKKASKDYQTSRIAIRNKLERIANSGKPYISEAFAAYDKAEDVYGPLQDNPLVSILIVSYNSNSDLLECYESISRQSYQNWEVVLVDNSDREDASDLTHKFFGGRASYVKQPNIGFAAGNNVAASQSKGDLLLLLNPDATLAEDALKELVNSLRFDGSAGIVSPKIYFRKEFLNVQFLDVPPQIGIDLDALTLEWTYKKILVNEGVLDGKIVSPNVNGKISIEVPIDPSIKSLLINFVDHHKDEASISKEINIRMQVGRRARPERIKIDTLPELKVHNLSRIDYSSARKLINNAGSGIREDGNPYDRGFAQEDHGQFSQKEYIQAFCGCCALIRRNIFAYRKLFIDELFAYYEDTELSHWCDKNNIPILYCPNSRVFHRHSESTSENSPSWNCLVYRSSKIYDLVKDCSSADIHAELVSDERYIELQGKIGEKLRQILLNYDLLLKGASRDRLIAHENTKSVAIYNTYMNSYGGGEKHILAIAQELSKNPDIEITFICERDFSLDDLLQYFRLNCFKAARLMVGKMTPKLTAFFDCFINSTFLSRHVSLSPRSYYIVSFPGEKISDAVKGSYIFLHNSDYTSKWSHHYWGGHKSQIIYPVLGETAPGLIGTDATDSCAQENGKEHLIISVGRYNHGGHCKNQQHMIKAFIEVVKENPELSDWRLRVMGSVDFSREESSSHYDECLRLSEGYSNVEVLGNVSPDLIASSYASASIYVHAAGLNVDLDAEPEKAEHFGIAVYDGLASGCVCVVFAGGGPVHMVSNLDGSSAFSSFEDMITCLSGAMRFRDNASSFYAASRASRQRAEEYRAKSQLSVDKILRSIQEV